MLIVYTMFTPKIKKELDFSLTPSFSMSGYQDSNLGPPAPKTEICGISASKPSFLRLKINELD
jgi:hypothetical protein